MTYRRKKGRGGCVKERGKKCLRAEPGQLHGCGRAPKDKKIEKLLQCTLNYYEFYLSQPDTMQYNYNGIQMQILKFDYSQIQHNILINDEIVTLGFLCKLLN